MLLLIIIHVYSCELIFMSCFNNCIYIIILQSLITLSEWPVFSIILYFMFAR